jgi:S1-C subfamily serine protease
MFDVSNNRATDQERAILRKLRVWIAALAVACLVAGIGIGAMLSGRTIVAQSDLQVARAPEALSASFAEIARRVEPAVVNIETTQAQIEVSEKDEDKHAASAAASSSVRKVTFSPTITSLKTPRESLSACSPAKSTAAR